MSKSNAFSHSTLEERRIFLTGITNGSTKTAIAQNIGKDKLTIGKEIRLHRALTHENKMPPECNNCRKCLYEHISILRTVPNTSLFTVKDATYPQCM